MKLTLVRHTSLQIAPGICYGQADIDVGVGFWDEVNQLKTKLAGFQFDAVYASPLQRCTKLAAALDYGEAIEDARLMELNFGDWETYAWDNIPRDIFDAWAHDYANQAPPKGETFGQLQQRAIHILDELKLENTGKHILIVTHGGLIRALLAHVLNMELKGLFRFNIDYASVTELDFSEKIPKINRVNF